MYNDDYKPRTANICGVEYELAEEDYHILRNRRADFGLAQQQVANLAGIQLRQYQRLESGERSIRGASLRIALSICSVLQLDPYRFVPEIKR